MNKQAILEKIKQACVTSGLLSSHPWVIDRPIVVTALDGQTVYRDGGVYGLHIAVRGTPPVLELLFVGRNVSEAPRFVKLSHGLQNLLDHTYQPRKKYADLYHACGELMDWYTNEAETVGQ